MYKLQTDFLPSLKKFRPAAISKLHELKTKIHQELVSVSGIRYQVSEACDSFPLKYQVSVI